MTESEEILRLRAARAKIEDIKHKLQDVREEQARLEKKADSLLSQQRDARKERRDAVFAADAARIPRLRIAKEVGMQRGNLYKLLDEEKQEP